MKTITLRPHFDMSKLDPYQLEYIKVLHNEIAEEVNVNIVSMETEQTGLCIKIEVEKNNGAAISTFLRESSGRIRSYLNDLAFI